ncbi:serine/threonine-protein kinase [Thermoflavimicrobium daqui]|uniref:non-specific serine/threonine protein kinase n=1 Tax=Thermoflavimicrobium daqui TaxID=2137476 RepID=A0A364K924_9BACL|nr:serine/threonine-protein kinase [Thermoflavimicrobium daqui]RAL26710.1 hypothetical protein DL897_01270 [Thermoflavimicrobium daqui]
MEGQNPGERYHIFEKVGSGGMGKVYRARDEHLDRDVAIKIMDLKRTKDQIMFRRFMKEAKIMAKPSHPHVVKIYDIGKSNELDYIVMELMEGPTLKENLKEKGVFLSAEAYETILQILSGMEEVHQHGVIHRDLKPHNIMRGKDGKWKVTDFGISRILTSNDRRDANRNCTIPIT